MYRPARPGGRIGWTEPRRQSVQRARGDAAATTRTDGQGRRHPGLRHHATRAHGGSRVHAYRPTHAEDLQIRPVRMPQYLKKSLTYK